MWILFPCSLLTTSKETVLFEQALPEGAVERARKQVQDCDLLLVIGSTLKPGCLRSSFPRISQKSGTFWIPRIRIAIYRNFNGVPLFKETTPLHETRVLFQSMMVNFLASHRYC